MAKFPIIEVKKVKDIDNHSCIRVDGINVCTCIFKYKCPKCGKTIKKQTIMGAKDDLKRGCSSCIKKPKKGSKYYSKINLNKVISKDKNYLKTIGNIGEHTMGKELIMRGYKVYIGYIGNEPDIDLIVKNPKNNKMITVQVKTTDFDHNNYPSNNGSSLFCAKQGKIKFDFLVCYMINYDIFYIIPKKDLETVFLAPQKKPKDQWKVHVKTNWLHKYNIKTKATPFIGAWHLIDEALK